MASVSPAGVSLDRYTPVQTEAEDSSHVLLWTETHSCQLVGRLRWRLCASVKSMLVTADD